MSEQMVDKFKLKIMMLEDKMLSADVVEVIVDTNVFLPSMFTVVIKDDPDSNLGIYKYMDNDPRFQIGNSISIGFEVTDKLIGMVPVSKTLIEGEITSVEPTFSEGKAEIKIRGYDRMHRLMRGKKTRAFLKTNEASIIFRLAGEAGMVCEVSGTPPLFHEYCMQNNQSDWEFLWERSRLYGYQLYVDGKILHVVDFDTPRSFTPVDLSLSVNLKKFDPRLVSMGQVSSYTAVGWDPERKMEITSTSDSSSQTTKIGEFLSGNTAALFFGKSEDTSIGEKKVNSTDEAKAIAQARFDENQSQFIKASGEVTPGEPTLIAGAMAFIHGVGTRFSGTYYITEARHIWRRGNYSVQFQVSGRNPHTIRHLLTGNKPSTSQFNSVVIGKVTSLKDPDNIGRVKVEFPWMPKTFARVESQWARIAVPSGGLNRGLYFAPEVGDEVLVAFELGDMNFPYIIGALWNKVDTPPKGTAEIISEDGKVNQRIIRSRAGHTIILDDTAGKEQIIVQDKTEKNSIVIDSPKNSLTIKSEGDLIIEAGGKIIIKSKGDFSIKSETKADIEANQSANVKAGPSQLELQTAGAAFKGTKVDVQANTQVSVQGTATVQIQGGIVKIN